MTIGDADRHGDIAGVHVEDHQRTADESLVADLAVANATGMLQ